MTKNQNYLKIVGSKTFVENAKKTLEPSFLTIYESEIKQSDSEPRIYYSFVHCVENNVYLGPVRQDQAQTAPTPQLNFNPSEATST